MPKCSVPGATRKETSKRLRNGSQEGAVSCWTLSPPVLLWFGYPWTASLFPSQVGCRLWGHCGPPPKQRGHARRGLIAHPGTAAFLSLCEASNIRGANSNKSIVEHMPRNIFGEPLDTKSPELFGCLLTKRRRDGAGENLNPRGCRDWGVSAVHPSQWRHVGAFAPLPGQQLLLVL